MAAVALDADVLIGFLDPGDAQHDRAVAELQPRISTGDKLLVSASVYAEILVRPISDGTDAVVEGFLEAARAEVVPVDRTVARRAAELRTRHHALRLPDALSLATALVAGAQLVTLDESLKGVAARESSR